MFALGPSTPSHLSMIFGIYSGCAVLKFTLLSKHFCLSIAGTYLDPICQDTSNDVFGKRPTKLSENNGNFRELVQRPFESAQSC